MSKGGNLPQTVQKESKEESKGIIRTIGEALKIIASEKEKKESGSYET